LASLIGRIKKKILYTNKKLNTLQEIWKPNIGVIKDVIFVMITRGDKFLRKYDVIIATHCKMKQIITPGE
jgi:hypothetical protein